MGSPPELGSGVGGRERDSKGFTGESIVQLDLRAGEGFTRLRGCGTGSGGH